MSLQLRNVLEDSKRKNDIVQHAVNGIILQENNKIGFEAETHENIDSDINENHQYEIYNISLDEKKEKEEWRKREFESGLKYKYDIEIHNGIIYIHGNKVKESDEWNLLHDILNHPKRTKKLNNYYSPIPDGHMNTQKGKAKLNKFRIIFNSGRSYKIVTGRLIKNSLLKKTIWYSVTHKRVVLLQI